VATPRVSVCLNLASVENGWTFSNKLLRLSRELRFLGIATRQGALDSLRLFKRMPLLSGWIYFRSMRMKAAISTVLSALSPGGRAAALLVTSSPTALINRDLIIKLTAQHHLPAIYPFRNFATGGGLTSYGPDLIDPCRRAASYVDRILKGEKPADLPVQAPTKFELVINLKTAKALGLDVPSSVLARADEVIE
jgi:hypothetical protein